MTTIRARVEKLATLGNTKKPQEAIYFVTLPAPDDADYQQVLDNIIKREAAGQRVVVFEVVNASNAV